MKPADKRWITLGLIVIAIFTLSFLGQQLTAIAAFNNSVIGRAVATILVSGILIPTAKYLWPILGRESKLSKILQTLEETANRNSDINSPETKRLFKKLYKQDLSRDQVDSMSNKDAAFLILGLQHHFRDIGISSDLSTRDFVLAAERAAADKSYQQILLKLALRTALLPHNEEADSLAKTLLSRKSGLLDVRLRSEDEDHKFFGRLSNATNEHLTIFSTTSQISSTSTSLLSEVSARIKKLDLFLVSPLAETDQAITQLTEEYDVPDCAIPKGQFLEDRTFDVVRRVFRVLMAIESALDLKEQAGIDVNVFLFRKAYPGLKLRVLKERGYMQILPGSLKYANNLYRFGIELTDRDLIDQVSQTVSAFKSNEELVCPLPLDKLHVDHIKASAFREAYTYISKQGKNVDALEALSATMGLALKNQNTGKYIEAIVNLGRTVRAAIMAHDFASSRPSAFALDGKHTSHPSLTSTSRIVSKYDSGVIKHVSAGVIFISDNQILMIQKRRPPYDGKWSIVAGHVEENETAQQTVRREALEEIGVDIEKSVFLKRFVSIPGDICRHGASCHEWFLFVSDQAPKISDLTPSSDEIIECKWISLDDLPPMNASSLFTFATRFILSDLGLL